MRGIIGRLKQYFSSLLFRLVMRLPRSQKVKLVAKLTETLPVPAIKGLIFDMTLNSTQKLNSADALRFLFEMDAEFYKLQGKYSIAYGNGTHTKHRHMKYHDFFVDRVQPGQHVLDIGCGIGAVAFDVAARSDAHVTGIDLSQDNIKRALELYSHPNVNYILGDALKELPSDQFDVVILSNVLEHLPDRSNFLQRVQKHIHPSHMLIRVPLFERDWRVPLKKELNVEWRLDETHEIEYTLDDFQAEIQAAGLRITHQDVKWGEIWADVESVERT